MATNKREGSKSSKGTSGKTKSKKDEKVWQRLFNAEQEVAILKGRNTTLLRNIEQLNCDKAELKTKLESEQKRNGEILSGGGDQLTLTGSMGKTVNRLVQEKFFPVMPHCDKTMFHQANLAAPIIKALNIADCDVAKYMVDLRRVTINRFTYWREYCGNDVKREYISKCCS